MAALQRGRPGSPPVQGGWCLPGDVWLLISEVHLDQQKMDWSCRSLFLQMIIPSRKICKSHPTTSHPPMSLEKFRGSCCFYKKAVSRAGAGDEGQGINHVTSLLWLLWAETWAARKSWTPVCGFPSAVEEWACVWGARGVQPVILSTFAGRVYDEDTAPLSPGLPVYLLQGLNTRNLIYPACSLWLSPSWGCQGRCLSCP